MKALFILLSILSVSANHLFAQDRSSSVIADWMASPDIREELEIDENQEEEILRLINMLRQAYVVYQSANRVPLGNSLGPRAGLIADELPKFQKLKQECLEKFEIGLWETLDPDQSDTLLGRLVAQSGPRSILESSQLRARLNITKNQFKKIEDIYFDLDDQLQAFMHLGDKLQFVTDADTMAEKGAEYVELRSKLVRERIAKARERVDKAQEQMDDNAVLAMTPDQKVMMDDLETKYNNYVEKKKKEKLNDNRKLPPR